MKTAVLWVLLAGLLWFGYRHWRQDGVLQAEIDARGKSIEQLAQLAAKKRVVYVSAKKAYDLKPSLETCAPALSACEVLDSTNQATIGLLNQQITTYEKMNRSRKLFGFLPRPVVGVGIAWCPTKAPACLFGGFPITR